MLGPELPVARHAMFEEPEAPPSRLQEELAPKIPAVPPSARGTALAGFLLGYVGFALAAAYTWILSGPGDAPYRYVLTAAMAMMAIGFTLAFVMTRARGTTRAA